MAGLDRRFGPSLREDPIDRPGLVIDDANDTYVILADGSRVLLDGSGATGPPGPTGPAGESTFPGIDARIYGVTGDGSDQLAEMNAALAAADTGFGSYLPILLPPGDILISDQLNWGYSNVTWIGQGSRGGPSGTSIIYAGPAGQDFTVAGGAGHDWSNSHISGIKIIQQGGGFTTGVGLRVFNPTNGSSVSDIVASGAPDGQIAVYGAGGSGNPGPNFFKLEDFFCIGGKKPLSIEQGAENMLVQFGGIDLDSTSTHGMYIGGGEVGFCLLTQSVKVEGSFDVPSFFMAGLSDYTFEGCMNYDNALNPGHVQPSFMYSNPGQENPQVTLIGCSSKGRTKCFEAAGLSILIPGNAAGITQFSYQTLENSLLGPSRAFDDPTGHALILHNDVYLAWTSAAGSSGTTDTEIKRAAAGKVNVGKLAVANSVAATTPGSVVKKIEVFDEAGASIGFMAVHSSIT